MGIIEWSIIGTYLVFVLGVGFYVKKQASQSRRSFFLADRSLPWWWAGISIAATTFAADTPLAVTGIIAEKGLSGNWLWYAWIGAHAAVVVFFARNWSRSGTLTDAELISIRYSGPVAPWLRYFRSFLSGFVINCIVLGWVIKAMVKISSQFFHWDQVMPSAMLWLSNYWPTGTPLSSPSDGVTLIGLLVLVGVYSSLGGLRGVVITDLVQFALALFGSIWLACEVWSVVGGQAGIIDGLSANYGAAHTYLDFMPSEQEGWLSALGVGSFVFAMYLFVQSFSNINVDGGGYMMQRLNAAKSEGDAQKAALVFVIIHYLVRIWPWFVVGVAALVLFPIDGTSTLWPELSSVVNADRELAYPVLINSVLSPVARGLVLASLLAAFMSTIDTHINWGASYVVNDWYLSFKPEATRQQQVRVARLAVLTFVLVAILVSFQIDTIEQAWKWIAAIGASLGVPTFARWFWARVTALSELVAVVFGLSVAVGLATLTDLPYEVRLLFVACSSLSGMLLSIAVGPRNSAQCIENFQSKVQPLGAWPKGVPGQKLTKGIVQWALLVSIVVFLYWVGQKLLF